jgi:hypothetical protein
MYTSKYGYNKLRGAAFTEFMLVERMNGIHVQAYHLYWHGLVDGRADLNWLTARIWYQARAKDPNTNIILLSYYVHFEGWASKPSRCWWWKLLGQYCLPREDIDKTAMFHVVFYPMLHIAVNIHNHKNRFTTSNSRKPIQTKYCQPPVQWQLLFTSYLKSRHTQKYTEHRLDFTEWIEVAGRQTPTCIYLHLTLRVQRIVRPHRAAKFRGLQNLLKYFFTSCIACAQCAGQGKIFPTWWRTCIWWNYLTCYLTCWDHTTSNDSLV